MLAPDHLPRDHPIPTRPRTVEMLPKAGDSDLARVAQIQGRATATALAIHDPTLLTSEDAVANAILAFEAHLLKPATNIIRSIEQFESPQHGLEFALSGKSFFYGCGYDQLAPRHSCPRTGWTYLWLDGHYVTDEGCVAAFLPPLSSYCHLSAVCRIPLACHSCYRMSLDIPSTLAEPGPLAARGGFQESPIC